MITLTIADPHPATDGHFSGNPIVPGAALLDHVLDSLGIGPAGLRDAKFLHPVKPGDVLTLTLLESRFQAVLPDGTVALRGSIAA